MNAENAKDARADGENLPTSTPTPCLRCGSAKPLTTTPRDELYFYTARISLSVAGHGLASIGRVTLNTDVDKGAQGRLCAPCTRSFNAWLKLEALKPSTP